MRIAFLTWRDTSHPDGGGSEVYVESVGRELAERGHDVWVVCARHPGAPAHEVREGLTIHRVGGRLTVYPRALAWLLGPGRNVDAVVDVVNGLPFGVPLVRRRGVVALYHHLHNEQWRLIYPGTRGRFGWFVESRVSLWLYRNHPILTVSGATAADLRALGVPKSHITIARNGLAKSSSTFGPKSTTPRLSVLGRLVPHKRVEQAFTVLANLAPEFPDLRLDVVGEGWWYQELVADAARQGVRDRVTFHGHLPAGSRDRVLRASWAMLVPSIKEGWCLAVTEAGAQGTPCVAYAAAGGVRESIEHGRTGILVGDLDEMVTSTRSLLRSAEVREAMGSAARLKASRHTWSTTADVFETVLADAN